MNLKQARQHGKVKQFAKEHENKDPHPMGKERFAQVIDLITRRAGATPGMKRRR